MSFALNTTEISIIMTHAVFDPLYTLLFTDYLNLAFFLAERSMKSFSKNILNI